MADAGIDDDAAVQRQRAKDARRAARSAAIKSDIQELMPVRKRDKGDSDMVRELAGENRYRGTASMRSDQYEGQESGRDKRKAPREAMRVSYDPAIGDDPELSAAAPRTPLHTPHGSSQVLSNSMGYFAPVATVTMQPVATSYFRGGSDLAASVMPVPAPAANGSGSSSFLGLPPRVPMPFSSRLGQGAAGGSEGVASGQSQAARGDAMRVRVYEESIATGDFRRVDAGIMQQAASQLGAKMGPALSFSATVLRARQESSGGCCGGGRAQGGNSVNELDPAESESMYGRVGLAVQSGCRIAQGLLAGTLLVIILQLDRLSDPIKFVQFMGPVLPPIRIMMYVLSVMAFLGATEQAMETRDVLGAWSASYAVITDAASLRLSSTVRYTWIATLAYLGTCVTCFASMQADNQMKALGDKGEYALRSELTLSGVVSTWKGLLSVRFVLVLIGMLASMAAASTPTDVYRAIKQAEEAGGAMVAGSMAVAAKQAHQNQPSSHSDSVAQSTTIDIGPHGTPGQGTPQAVA